MKRLRLVNNLMFSTGSITTVLLAVSAESLLPLVILPLIAVFYVGLNSEL